MGDQRARGGRGRPLRRCHARAPPQSLNIATIRKARKIAQALAKALGITGPFNVQYLAKLNEVKVIECNLRASRSFPFVSKVTGNNFVIEAMRRMLGLPAR